MTRDQERILAELAERIGDLAGAIMRERRKVQIHEQSGADHRQAAAQFRQQNDPDAELPAATRFALDAAERGAIAARAELHALQRALAEARGEYVRGHPSPIAATMLLDREISSALGPLEGR